MRCGSCWREWNSCPTIVKESLIGQPKKSILTAHYKTSVKSIDFTEVLFDFFSFYEDSFWAALFDPDFDPYGEITG